MRTPWNKGIPCSNITKEKISLTVKNKWKNPDYRTHMIQVHKGQGIGDTNISKRPDIRKKISIKLKGRIFSEETIQRMKLGQRKRFENKQNHWNWKGGITNQNRRLRNTALFREWRKLVFERDDYICQRCMKRGGNLEPHHIRQFATYPNSRFDVNNGVTYCRECHGIVDKFRAPLKYWREIL